MTLPLEEGSRTMVDEELAHGCEDGAVAWFAAFRAVLRKYAEITGVQEAAVGAAI
jgi:hypothetical protein